MAAASYDEALRRVLVHEGGYSNHPSDPGGPTNFGINCGLPQVCEAGRHRGRRAGHVR